MAGGGGGECKSNPFNMLLAKVTPKGGAMFSDFLILALLAYLIIEILKGFRKLQLFWEMRLWAEWVQAVV